MQLSLVLIALLAAKPLPTPKPFEWPMPDVVEEIPVAGISRVRGVPVKLHIIRVKHSAEEMLQRYATAFDEAGFFIDPHQRRRFAQPHLTALDPRTLISHTVLLQPNPDGTTTCILGEANMKKIKRPGAAPYLLPDAKVVMHVQQEGSTLLSFETAKRPDAVRKHYREALGREGWKAGELPGEEDLFSRGAQRLQLLIQDKTPGKTHVALIQQG